MAELCEIFSLCTCCCELCGNCCDCLEDLCDCFGQMGPCSCSSGGGSSPKPDAIKGSVYKKQSEAHEPEHSVLHTISRGTARQQQMKPQPVAKEGMSVMAYQHMDGPLSISGDFLAKRLSPRLLMSGSSPPNTHLSQVNLLPPALQAGGIRRYSPYHMSSASADVLSFGHPQGCILHADNHYRIGERAQS